MPFYLFTVATRKFKIAYPSIIFLSENALLRHLRFSERRGRWPCRARTLTPEADGPLSASWLSYLLDKQLRTSHLTSLCPSFLYSTATIIEFYNKD